MPRQHFTAERAIVQHESQELCVGQGVVFGDGDDRADVFFLIGVAPEAGDPLHAVGIEAEEVVRRRTQSGILGR